MSIDFFVGFWTNVDENGCMNWRVTRNKISILYYFNDENTDLEKNFSILNCFAVKHGLDTRSLKLPFTMEVSKSEDWNYDYYKRIDFFIFSYLFIMITSWLFIAFLRSTRKI